jgi:hypothetical protein
MCSAFFIPAMRCQVLRSAQAYDDQDQGRQVAYPYERIYNDVRSALAPILRAVA